MKPAESGDSVQVIEEKMVIWNKMLAIEKEEGNMVLVGIRVLKILSENSFYVFSFLSVYFDI